MQELLVSEDILKTEYTISMFYFSLISNKIFLFTKDYEDYIKYERKMKFDPKKDLPFPFASDEVGLISAISTFDEKDISIKANNFREKLGICDDGHSAERVAKLLVQVMKGSNLK